MKMNRRRLLSGGLSLGAVLSLASMGVTIPEVKAKEVHETSLEKINNRRILDYIQKIMAEAMEQSLFEFNDAGTRGLMRSLTETRLRNLQNSRAIYDFLVICDETNNTPKVIDANESRITVYVKINNTMSFYRIDGSVVKTGVEFSELVGSRIA